MRRNKVKVCHISTVHTPFDVRIFYKECRSLAEKGYEVYFIVPKDKDETIDGVNFIAINNEKSGRLKRVFKKPKEAYKKALKIDADIYHFHDPELIPIGLKLKKKGKIVIYDVHEDVPRQILTKHYLNKIVAKIISFFFEIYEDYAARKFDAIVTATPFIRDRFLKINKNTIDINNYPIVKDFSKIPSWEDRENIGCYIGGISKIRGVKELIYSLRYLNNFTLYMAGDFESFAFEQEIKSLKEWKKVFYLGFIERKEINRLLKKCKMGFVNFLPYENHLNSQPNKIFEYLLAGIPVILSNFSSWKQMVEKYKFGIYVDPKNPKEISEAIEYILTHPMEAYQMGVNGRKAVLSIFNWENEEKSLLKLYKNLLIGGKID